MVNRRKLYISSTFIDLAAHRAVLKAALEKAGYDVECMERYSAFDERPLDRCLSDVADCDAYVLILAHRYGYKPHVGDGRSLSITEREYERARETSLPCLGFCVVESFDWPPEFVDDPDSADGLRVTSLRARVKQQHGVGSFTSPESLAVEVLAALSAPDFRRAAFEFPTVKDLNRIRNSAMRMLEVGRRSAKMPTFIAPLKVSAFEENDNEDQKAIGIDDIVKRAGTGESFVLFGDGGIGKTTFLREIAAACSIEGQKRLPLYVDAALWARSALNLFDYLETTQAARLWEVTSTELARLTEKGLVVLLINGWNEITADRKFTCQEAITQLSASDTPIPLIVASRTRSDTPSLASAKSIEIHGLTWQGQSAIIREELEPDAAAALLALMARNTKLRHAARSPLILRGLIAQSKSGGQAGSVYDLLGAVVHSFEIDSQRALALAEPPLEGFHRHYLEDLACQFTVQATTTLSREDALPVLRDTAVRLVERGMLGSIPNPTQVLDALCVRHLVQMEEGAVRFSHQRFQEYYAAATLLRDANTLASAVNLPAWDEALHLVAGKLKVPAPEAEARALLVAAASAVDVGFACELSGACGFSVADDRNLYAAITAKIDEFTASKVPEIANLGMSFALVSRLPYFARQLWPLLEDESQQVRLHTFRLADSGLTLDQLGSTAAARIAGWSSDRRAELLHEIGSNPENYEYLVDTALHESNPKVRVAAIAALFWHFPASDVPAKAWLAAPVDAQTDHQLLNCIEGALADGQAGAEVRDRIKVLFREKISDAAKLQLAIGFPEEVDAASLSVIFEYLRGSEGQRSDSAFVRIAAARAPERLYDLASEIVVSSRSVPEWAKELTQNAPPAKQAEVFEKAWTTLQGEHFQAISVSALGPLADHAQILRTVRQVIEDVKSRGVGLSPLEQERKRVLHFLLAHARGHELLCVALDLGAAASYAEAEELLRLLTTRIDLDIGASSDRVAWSPTEREVHQLIGIYGEKKDEAPVSRDGVFVSLCAIACKVAPEKFEGMLVTAYRRQLECWTVYQAAFEGWQKRPSAQTRPTNPHCMQLHAAVARRGPVIIPPLLDLFGHPSAMYVLPQAISHAVNGLWNNKSRFGGGTVTDDMVEGERRRGLGRVLQQPDDRFQRITDNAARELGKRLDLTVAGLLAKQQDNGFNKNQASFGVSSLLDIVSHIPSREAVGPAMRALACGFANEYAFIGALRGFVRHGTWITDPAVAAQLETLHLQMASRAFLPQQERYVVAELSQLMFCVRPPATLVKPLSHYVAEWQRFSYAGDVARGLGKMPLDSAWDALFALARETLKGGPSEEILSTLASQLTVERLPQFFGLLKQGALTHWHPRSLSQGDIAKRIASLVRQDRDQLRGFLAMCLEIGSVGSDALGLAVFSSIAVGEESCIELALSAIDAGRLAERNSPTYHIIVELLTSKTSLARRDQYQISPAACNTLRLEIFKRASTTAANAPECRRLLAAVEGLRIEYGRPLDERRHPQPQTGTAWTDVFALS